MPSQKVPHAHAPFETSFSACIHKLAEIMVPHPGKKMFIIRQMMCIGDLMVGTADPQHERKFSLSL